MIFLVFSLAYVWVCAHHNFPTSQISDKTLYATTTTAFTTTYFMKSEFTTITTTTLETTSSEVYDCDLNREPIQSRQQSLMKFDPNDPTGINYNGTVSKTESGRTCEMWNNNYHYNHNYCRNPDGDVRPWCFTSCLGFRLWERCAYDITLDPVVYPGKLTLINRHLSLCWDKHHII